MLGDIPAALTTLTTLERLHPRFSRLFQERGQCYVALKQAPQAIDAFLRGVHINPALPASWSMLEGLFRMTRQAESASDAAAHVATLKKLPPEVVTATALFSDGELAESEEAGIADALGTVEPEWIRCRPLLGDTSAASNGLQLAAVLAVAGDAGLGAGALALVTGIDRDGMVGCALLGGPQGEE